MILDEAIKHAQEMTTQDCTECAKQHQQLAEWLLGLKEFRAENKKRTYIHKNQNKIYTKNILELI